ncbi:MAG: cation transporter [Pseudarcicella sp.]|nr:cation transporter [Pseudarcicella sp.]MBP6411121.1 cation transporter [Pseudarcicella sp.]
MSIKFVAYFYTHSSAVLVDALESIINVVAVSFAFYSVHLSSLPKDNNHPYGHGKIEFFSAGLEGVLIVLASIYIVIHSVQSFYGNSDLQHLDFGLAVVMLGVVVNWFLGYFLLKEGNIQSSPTLIADGIHLKIDAYSGLILIVALLASYWFGWLWADAVASLMFALYMFYQGVKIIRKSIGGLMDETDEEMLKKVVDVLKTHRKNNWIDIHNLRIQRYGGDLHLDCHLTLPHYWTLDQVHEQVHDFEVIVNKKIDQSVEVFIHADPCLPSCCKYCLLQNCDSRKNDFEQKINWSIKNLSTNQKHFTTK